MRLINAINLVNLPSLPRVNLDETSILDLMLLNILFGVGYCSSLAATSFLLSRLYLTSKHACKLAILGALFSVLAINFLNTCWLRSSLNHWPSTATSVRNALNDFGCELKSLNNFSSFERAGFSLVGTHTGAYDGTEPTRSLSCTLVYHAASLPIGLLTMLSENVYTAQTALYLLCGFFQAQLEYSTRLLLIERFSQEKLLRVISLHRCFIGLGHLSLLFVRIIVKRLNANQSFVRLGSICESDDCRILLSSLIVACSSSAAIVLIRFISNRSIRPPRGRAASIPKSDKVVKKASWLPSALLRPFRAFKALKLFRKLERSDDRRVHRAKSDPGPSKRSTANTLKLEKQLSDSDLKALEILRDLANQRDLANFNDLDERKRATPVLGLRRTKSDQQLPKGDEVLDELSRSNYLVDCVQCGRYFVVEIDLNKVNLIEICVLDDLKVP